MHHLRGDENVVTLKEVFEDKHNVHLVMELAAGGELFDNIVARGHYTCAQTFTQDFGRKLERYKSAEPVLSWQSVS